jgi:hypothetical protein
MAVMAVVATALADFLLENLSTVIHLTAGLCTLATVMVDRTPAKIRRRAPDAHDDDDASDVS